jgi:hypothetical protein
MIGTTVFFESRVPTIWEYENCRIVELTLDTPWNPGDVKIALLSSNNSTLEQTTYCNLCAMERIPRCTNHCRAECECGSDLSVFDQSSMTRRMISAVEIATSYRDEQSISFVGAKDHHSQVTAKTVARKFRCGLETAQKTLKATT